MIQFRPVLMGALMAPMLLWMAHKPLTTGAFDVGWATLWFVLAHFVVFGVVAVAVFLLAKRAPRIARWVNIRLHRPRLGHMVAMVIGALISAGIIHSSIHGGLI